MDRDRAGRIYRVPLPLSTVTRTSMGVLFDACIPARMLVMVVIVIFRG
jgi:hypothetical protein